MSSTKRDRVNAEKAAVNFCASYMKYNHTRRAVGTRFNKVDFFGCDVMARDCEGNLLWVQATAGKNQAVTKRRRKLEQVVWNDRERVLVVQMRKEKKGNAFHYHFRVHEYDHMNGGTWSVWGGKVKIPRSWFKLAQEEADE